MSARLLAMRMDSYMYVQGIKVVQFTYSSRGDGDTYSYRAQSTPADGAPKVCRGRYPSDYCTSSAHHSLMVGVTTITRWLLRYHYPSSSGGAHLNWAVSGPRFADWRRWYNAPQQRKREARKRKKKQWPMREKETKIQRTPKKKRKR